MDSQLAQVQRRKTGLAPALTILLASLALPSSRAFTALEAVQAEGVLRMATVSGAATYYEDGKGRNGFEYLLAKAFADRLGVRLEVHLNDSRGQINAMLRDSTVDFAAASLIARPRIWRPLRFSTPYDNVELKLISPLGSVAPQSLRDLPAGALILIADGLQSDSLAEVQRDNPHQHWKILSGVESVDLMRRVHDGDIGYAIVDSIAYAANRGLFPRARAAFSLTAPEPVSWAFPTYNENGDDSLVRAADLFLHDYQQSGELQSLKDTFFDHGSELTATFVEDFMTEVASTLPKYQKLFKLVAEEYGIDWSLVAAIAYQESRWNPAAVSPTGARGMMMLTTAAAGEVGVSNRHDTIESLRGGTEYFLRLRSLLPTEVREPDRTWLALSAYNGGLAHVEDARRLTERRGEDPNRWPSVKRNLLLLQEREFYRTVKHGFVRSGQAVAFVHRVRRYQSVLQWLDGIPPKRQLYSVSGLPLEQLIAGLNRPASAL